MIDPEAHNLNNNDQRIICYFCEGKKVNSKGNKICKKCLGQGSLGS